MTRKRRQLLLSFPWLLLLFFAVMSVELVLEFVEWFEKEWRDETV